MNPTEVVSIKIIGLDCELVERQFLVEFDLEQKPPPSFLNANPSPEVELISIEGKSPFGETCQYNNVLPEIENGLVRIVYETLRGNR